MKQVNSQERRTHGKLEGKLIPLLTTELYASVLNNVALSFRIIVYDMVYLLKTSVK